MERHNVTNVHVPDAKRGRATPFAELARPRCAFGRRHDMMVAKLVYCTSKRPKPLEARS